MLLSIHGRKTEVSPTLASILPRPSPSHLQVKSIVTLILNNLVTLLGCVFQARIATFELYRRSTIGNCLTETLDEMVQNGTLSHELAIQVLVQFDKSMTEALETQVKSKVSIKDCLGAFNLLLVIVRGGIDLC
ncbi:transcription initiation factor IIA subunit [Trifolium repens]|nr:transcription initiation factor IIA subunit [Trifolium repens]